MTQERGQSQESRKKKKPSQRTREKKSMQLLLSREKDVDGLAQER